MDLIEIMRMRHSVRRYSGEEIPEEKLENIIKAGTLAPTSRDLQPCEFCIVRDKSTLRELAKAKKAGASFLADAAVGIAVFADPEVADTWIEDSSIALTYMMLEATEQGVGSCWIQMHLRQDADGADAEANCCRILGADEKYRIVGILSLGMPVSD